MLYIVLVCVCMGVRVLGMRVDDSTYGNFFLIKFAGQGHSLKMLTLKNKTKSKPGYQNVQWANSYYVLYLLASSLSGRVVPLSHVVDRLLKRKEVIGHYKELKRRVSVDSWKWQFPMDD